MSDFEFAKDEVNSQLEATNKLLLQMNKNQRESNKNLIRSLIIVVVCYTVIVVTMIIGFFVYESQFEYMDTLTTETIDKTYEQEVSGDNSSINNVEGDQYNDNATHNE